MLQPKTQEEQFSESLSQDRMFARLAAFFGLPAVVLVATGLYATLAYKIVRRTAEIGVRMAVGAQRQQVLWMIFRESLVACLLGTILGLPAAIAGARLLKAMLFGLSPQRSSNADRRAGRNYRSDASGQLRTRPPRIVGESDGGAAV